MNLDSIDVIKLTDVQRLKLNLRLPKPDQEIIGDVSVLPMTLLMGCQIKILPGNDLRQWLKKENCFLLDGKKISYPSFSNDASDATTDYCDIGGDYFCIGDSSLGGRYKNHVDSFYPSTFFGFSGKNLLDIPIKQRQGWCCTVSKKRPTRDLIIDVIKSKHINKFQGNEWLCYDGIDERHQEIIDLMFRSPQGGKAAFIESCDGIDTQPSRNWSDRTFTDTFDKHQSHTNQFQGGIKNSAGGDLGHLLGPWHKTSLIELVSEATVDWFDPSEKMAKPLRAGMPFVVVASKKFLYRLRKMGFKTFHPYINESYDQQDNWRTRTEMAVDAMFDFSQSPQHLEQVAEICKHNQNIMVKIGKHNNLKRTAKKLKRLITFS